MMKHRDPDFVKIPGVTEPKNMSFILSYQNVLNLSLSS